MRDESFTLISSLLQKLIEISVYAVCLSTIGKLERGDTRTDYTLHQNVISIAILLWDGLLGCRVEVVS